MPLTSAVALQHELETAWERSDRIFSWLAPGALLAQPIPLRHPFLFYLGHLPAFAWNQLCRGALGRGSLSPALDELFARGIDPHDTAADASGGTRGETSRPTRWPDERSTLDYRDRVRQDVRAALDALPESAMTRVQLVLEHELMHHETLLYMLQELDHRLKAGPPPVAALSVRCPPRRSLRIPAGRARLGARRDALDFGWDNEFPGHEVDVPAFELDDRPVTNAEFLEFVEAGGYAQRGLWSEEAWSWLASRHARHPHGWQRTAGGWTVRAPFEDARWEHAQHWPASVSWAEAAAFARHAGRRLMTEPEFHRAAWGDDADVTPDALEPAHLGFRGLAPRPVCSGPASSSAHGAHELIGNGWEWTATLFAPFPGFRADLPDYAGYSADFFDGRHYVLLGASWATDARLVRRSFRNWYQPHYPYVFSKFRTAGPA